MLKINLILSNTTINTEEYYAPRIRISLITLCHHRGALTFHRAANLVFGENKPSLTNTAWGLKLLLRYFYERFNRYSCLLFCNGWLHFGIRGSALQFSTTNIFLKVAATLGRTWRLHFILAFYLKSLVSGFCLFLSQKWPHFFCTNPFFTRLNLSWICYFHFVLLQSIWSCISCPLRKGEISTQCCKILA